MSDILGWIAGVFAAVFPGFLGGEGPVFNGYVEADYHYAAPVVAGRIQRIAVVEGQVVTRGQLLVEMDDRTARAALREAEARVAEAAAMLDNLRTGAREDEIAVIRADLERAKAVERQGKINFDRTATLVERGVAAQSQWDSDRAALDAATAAVLELEAQLRVAVLPAREAELARADQALRAAEAARDAAEVALEEQKVLSPFDGFVEDIFFKSGEVAAAGAPVMSMYDPARMKAVLFLPETDRARATIGQQLALSCDGCREGIQARLVRLASSPQHTPPIIYSRDERHRLVFRAEALIPPGSGLLPGQPISLRPLP